MRSLQAGGKNVIFDETFTYIVDDKQIQDITLKVEVYDKDNMGDDELGKCDISLHRQDMQEDTKKKVTSERKAVDGRLYR